jgi:hypothetical protein
MMKDRVILAVAILVGSSSLIAQEWPQWGRDPQHTSAAPYVGQALNRNIVSLVYDPLVPQEMAGAAPIYGEAVLLAHYQAPLVDGDDVFMMEKSGYYSARNYSTQKWGEMKLSWNATHTALNTMWHFDSDWDPPGSLYDFWEPVFHPALANGYIYIPGAGGSIFKVNKRTGTAVTRINPFPTDDGGTKGTIFVVSPLTVDASGNIYYTAIQFTNFVNIFQNDVADSWLVKVTPFDVVQTVSFSQITVGAPLATDQCTATFTNSQLPWPPSPTAVPGTVTCGTQRPGINAAPAIAPNGTIYVMSRAHFISRYAFLVAVNPNLTQKWIASLRNRFRDGCGVPIALGGTLPANGAPGGCRVGANYGVDPATNTYGGGRIIDDSSSSPVVARDGSILYGSYTSYNYLQGHLMRFSSGGQYLGGFNFGWDITPGIWSHDGTFSIAIKDNHYGETGSYCGVEAYCPSDESGRAYPEEYLITQLSPTVRADAFADRGDLLMTKEWSYKNTNTQSCSRDANGNVTCQETNPNSFEWCVNAFVVDSTGVLYANSEDGNLFRIPQGAVGVTRIFQQLALGAAYTPTSIDSAGRIYSQNAGYLFVAGN